MLRPIEIRPHHFLCIPGYKGYNYNKENADSWDFITTLLKAYPYQRVKITMQDDSLCRECKHSETKGGTCNKNYVRALDQKVKSLLNLQEGEAYPYEDLMKKLFSIMNPKKHEEICGDCNWRRQGLCIDTFEKKDKI